MNEGRSQYIGIILLSIIVYLLAARFFKTVDTPVDEIAVAAEEVQSNDSLEATLSNLDANILEPSTIIIIENGDSVKVDAADYAAKNRLGDFYPLASGSEEEIILENELLKITLSSKGAQVKTVELKEFKDFNQDPLLLVEETQQINYLLSLANGNVVATEDLFFQTKGNGESVIFSAPAGNGSVQFTYTLPSNSYLVDYELQLNNLQSVLDTKADKLQLTWDYVASKHEQDMSSEKTKSTAYWKVFEEDVEHIGVGKSKEESIEASILWLSFKQRFFNATFLNENTFTDITVGTDIESDDSTKVAGFHGEMAMAVDFKKAEQSFDMQLFYGPNNYKMLKAYNNDMHQVVELSADFFLFRWVKWINAWLIIPLFNFIEKFIPNYGIIILIMTLIIKMILMPLTFKSYVSTAKQRVLKPELDELKKQFGDDSAGYSRAQMDLYSKTGVSMFGGCLPMLLQMPFLLAMFYFFPSSIELRQESFLWAQDLSTFDTIPLLTWAKSIPLLGNHLSVFTILMTVSSILMAKFNPQMQSQPSQPGMEMMKYMPYIFPFFLLFLFNSFPAALTYYYFLSNMITFGQQFVINKFFIDEEQIKVQLEENKKKPVKKSKWATKMEEVYKLQQQQQMQQKKK